MRGILLAGGEGSRLWPLTRGVSKHLLPVFDKPLIHFPLATLMLAGVTDVSIVSAPRDLDAFQRLLGDGSSLGMSLRYVVQEHPAGISDGMLRARANVAGDEFVLVLGDNIFHGPSLGLALGDVRELDGGVVLACTVSNPEDYAVAWLDTHGRLLDIQEKPHRPNSPWVVPGLYFYSNDVFDIAASLKPSGRGELEITDLNRELLRQDRLQVLPMPRGTAWFDAGSVTSLSDASLYVRTLEERQGVKIACLEEVAWRQGWLTNDQLEVLAQQQGREDLRRYLLDLLVSPTRAAPSPEQSA